MEETVEERHIHSYSSPLNVGHKGLSPREGPRLFDDEVYIQEKVDGCVTPDTKILMADLTYRYAGDLLVGDTLIGCSESPVNTRLEQSIVEVAHPITKDCYKIATEYTNKQKKPYKFERKIYNNVEVVASHDHPWLVDGKSNNLKSWKITEDLAVGDEIVSIPCWETDDSYEAEYIAGFFDGEGSLVIRGGWLQILEFLSSIRPKRLLTGAERIWKNAPTNMFPRQRVINIEKVGEQEVVGLQTSSKTYIAEGLLCHNSQLSFMRSEDGKDVYFRSRKRMVYPEDPGMFRAGVTAVLSVAEMLEPGWIYRGEYLAKPKHNTLCYDRTPKQHVVIYDIETSPTYFLDQVAVMEEAMRLGFEYAPVYYTGRIGNVESLKTHLDNSSILGGPIEGIVIKPVGMELFGADHKVIMAKYVREDFKEVHQKSWRESNPTKKDIIEQIIERFRTPQRWNKAVQHLREAGELEGTPRDIGKLFVEVPKDIGQEHKEEIQTILWKAFWKDISRGCTAGLAEWYKNKLVENEFEESK
jgi:hypothetical protein